MEIKCGRECVRENKGRERKIVMEREKGWKERMQLMLEEGFWRSK